VPVLEGAGFVKDGGLTDLEGEYSGLGDAL